MSYADLFIMHSPIMLYKKSLLKLSNKSRTSDLSMCCWTSDGAYFHIVPEHVQLSLYPSFCYMSFSCMHFTFIVAAMNLTPLKLPCTYHFPVLLFISEKTDNRFHSTINLLVLKDDYIHRYDEKTQCHLKSSPKNMQSNGQPIKSWVLCRVQWAHNLVATGLFFSISC